MPTSVSGGNFSRDMSNLSMFNIHDNWTNMSGMGPQGLLAGGPSAGVGMGQPMGSQYPGMWMAPTVGTVSNLSNPSQSCTMPYPLRSGPGTYSLPVSSPPSVSSPGSGLGGPLQAGAGGHGGVHGQAGCEQSYDLGAYSTTRDQANRPSWSPLTPPPL